jgi:hypothetical protein
LYDRVSLAGLDEVRGPIHARSVAGIRIVTVDAVVARVGRDPCARTRRRAICTTCRRAAAPATGNRRNTPSTGDENPGSARREGTRHAGATGCGGRAAKAGHAALARGHSSAGT